MTCFSRTLILRDPLGRRWKPVRTTWMLLPATHVQTSASSHNRVTRTLHSCETDKIYEAAVFKHWQRTPQTCYSYEKGRTLSEFHVSPTSLPVAAYQTMAQRNALGNNHHLADLKKQIAEFKVIKVIVGPTTKEE